MRLIDADALYEDMLYEMCGTGYQTLALLVIRRAPTFDPPPNKPADPRGVAEEMDVEVVK